MVLPLLNLPGDVPVFSGRFKAEGATNSQVRGCAVVKVRGGGCYSTM
jgi:hypothetical protein